MKHSQDCSLLSNGRNGCDCGAEATPAVAVQAEPVINGEPATARSILDALIDIHDDGQNNPEEHRCYVPEAWRDILAEARAYLAAHPAAPVTADDAVSDEARYTDERALKGLGAHATPFPMSCYFRDQSELDAFLALRSGASTLPAAKEAKDE